MGRKSVFGAGCFGSKFWAHLSASPLKKDDIDPPIVESSEEDVEVVLEGVDSFFD